MKPWAWWTVGIGGVGLAIGGWYFWQSRKAASRVTQMTSLGLSIPPTMRLTDDDVAVAYSLSAPGVGGQATQRIQTAINTMAQAQAAHAPAQNDSLAYFLGLAPAGTAGLMR